MEIINKILNKFLRKYLQRQLYLNGSANVIKLRKNYSKFQNLDEAEYKVFSQNGEDGIIDFILHSLKIKKPKFIEIGVGDYSESNTRFLFERSSCKGMIVDCIKQLKKKVSKNTKLWQGDLTIVENFVDSKNILNILKKYKFLNDIDLFSLDVDGTDYWLLEKLPKNFSKIAIIEINPYFGHNLEVSVPNINNFNRSNYHYSNLCFGMSLKAAVNLMDKKNFDFIGTNLARNNAFFISKKYKKKIKIKKVKPSKFKFHTDANFRESRDKKNNLTFLNGSQILNQIKECRVINLNSKKKNLVKLKHLI